MNGTSAFGVEHSDGFAKASTEPNHTKRNTTAAAGVAGVGTAGVLAGTKIPEHSHYSKETRKYIKGLPAGVHEVDTKMLAKRPRKLGARKQQTPYVAAMAQERPLESFKGSPVPITRYKNGIIQRDNAHSVMANAMKGRKTTIKIEDAPGHRPTRRTGEELVRRGQMKYQEKRLKRSFNLPEKKIEAARSKYKPSSRAANTHKRPHGVVEDRFKVHPQKFGVKQFLGAGKNVAVLAKRADPFGVG